MATRSATDLPQPPARLYLVAPPADDPASLSGDLERALDAADSATVAAVLLRLPEADESALVRYAEPILPVVQARGVALLFDGHASLAARTGADGAHLTGIDAFTAAVAELKPDRIAGAGGLATRHAAMLAAERGADYVMFGEPAAGDTGGGFAAGGQDTGRRPPFAAVVDRIAWWAEVFEAPCIGYAEDLEEVAALAAAGADFVALGAFAFAEPRGGLRYHPGGCKTSVRVGTAQMIAKRPLLLASLVAAAAATAAVTATSAVAQAPIQISPPAQSGDRPAAPAAKPKARPAPKAPAPKAAAPAAPTAPSAATKAAPKATLAAPRDDEIWPAPAPPPAAFAPSAAAPGAAASVNAYAAYQRGHYLTAFAEATRLASEAGEAKARALLGELYASGNGVPQDYKKAAEWYRLAAERGDAAGTFALALLHLAGRGGPRDLAAAAKYLEAATNLGHPDAAYDLALLYIDGQQFPQDFARAAELFRRAADAGIPEAQYALATLYKEGRGVPQDTGAAARLLRLASRAGNLDAQVEFAIALFNGAGVPQDEAGAAALLRKAANRGSPIAQNRLARILAAGRGVAANAVEAAQWHMIAKAGGLSDSWLDEFMAKLSPEERAAAEKAAKPWLAAITQSRT